MDIVCFNRYAGWYSDSGHLELIESQTDAELGQWIVHFQRPVIITEYGAGSLSGFHQVRPIIKTDIGSRLKDCFFTFFHFAATVGYVDRGIPSRISA